MKKLFFIAFLLIGCANAEIKRLPEPDNLIPGTLTFSGVDI